MAPTDDIAAPAPFALPSDAAARDSLGLHRAQRSADLRITRTALRGHGILMVFTGRKRALLAQASCLTVSSHVNGEQLVQTGLIGNKTYREDG